MNKQSLHCRPVTILLLALCLASLLTFSYRIHRDYYVMPIDFLIFLDAGKRFEKNGELYLRAENYAEKYHPSAAVYKFPPPFQLALIPLVELSGHISLLEIIKPLMIGMYVIALALLVRCSIQTLQLSVEQARHLSVSVGVIACWFMPFFESLRWLLAEIPLFLLFVLVAVLPADRRYGSFISGLLIAYAACIKIYPAFLGGIAIYRRDKAAIAGLVCGAVVTVFLSLYYFGFQEHRFYLSTLLPVLLNEPVIDKWINLNPEKFLYRIGLLDTVNGNIFGLVRIATLSALAFVLYRHRKVNDQSNLALVSLFVTSMYFCFPNYWPQYQIYLLLPICFLLGHYLQAQHRSHLVLLLLASVPLFVPDLLWTRFQGIAGNSLSLASILLFELRAVSTVVIWWMVVQTILNQPARSPSGR